MALSLGTTAPVTGTLVVAAGAVAVYEGAVAGCALGKLNKVSQNGVTFEVHTNDPHKPAHADVKSPGQTPTRVKGNAQPLNGNRKLTNRERKVFDANKAKIRSVIKKAGKRNKKAEQQKKQEKAER